MSATRLCGRAILGTILIVAVSSGCARTSPALPAGRAAEDVSPMLKAVIERHGIPGMCAGVWQGSRMIAEGAAGVREQGRDEAITRHDLFHLGSETKAMTASLCAMLVEEGRLRWDITLEEVFPQTREKMLPENRRVTLRQLLTQRSGFAEELGDERGYRKLASFAGTPRQARRACLEYVTGEKPACAAGERFIYSNVNYIIAGHMAETVTGREFEELMRERLFVPLGMSSADFGAPGRAGALDQPRGHRRNGRPVEPGISADNPPIYSPSGRVHCTLEDWAKFMAWHATLGESHPGLLTRESFTVLHAPVRSDFEPNLERVAPQSEGYAMGWFVFRGGTLVHSGTNTRWFAEQVVVPKEGFFVLVACNKGGDEAEGGCLEAVRLLLKNYHKVPARERNR